MPTADHPWWKSRKLWVAVVSLAAMTVLHFTGNEKLAEHVTVLGGVLLAALGLADFGQGAAIAKAEGDETRERNERMGRADQGGQNMADRKEAAARAASKPVPPWGGP